MICYVYDLEFRSVELKQSKQSEKAYVQMHFEDSDGKCYSLMSWDINFCSHVKKGDIVDLVLEIKFNKFIQVELKSIEVHDNAAIKQ